MSTHVHFNVAATVAAIAAQQREIAAEGLRRAATDRDKAFVRLQVGLDAFAREFIGWHLETHNACAERGDVINAAAAQFANIVLGFANNQQGGSPAENIADFMGAFAAAINMAQMPAEVTNSVKRTVSVLPMQGGSA